MKKPIVIYENKPKTYHYRELHSPEKILLVEECKGKGFFEKSFKSRAFTNVINNVDGTAFFVSFSMIERPKEGLIEFCCDVEVRGEEVCRI